MTERYDADFDVAWSTELTASWDAGGYSVREIEASDDAVVIAGSRSPAWPGDEDAWVVALSP